MSKKKGLSLDEKRKRIMDFFYEKLKEIERLCSKEKNINSMSIKDVLMSLVYDGMVDTDKIGTSVYFWAFPSKATQKLKNSVQSLAERIDTTQKKIRKVNSELDSAMSVREDTNERRELIEDLETKKAFLMDRKKELSLFERFAPARLENLNRESQLAFEYANRWTDNVFVIQTWLSNKFPIDDATFRCQFNIPDNFDYLTE